MIREAYFLKTDLWLPGICLHKKIKCFFPDCRQRCEINTPLIILKINALFGAKIVSTEQILQSTTFRFLEIIHKCSDIA